MQKNINIFTAKLKKHGLIKTLFYVFMYFILGPLYKFLYITLYKGISSSYSQKYEDYIIDYLLEFKKEGFYVDIGANDPDFLSNTKRFYDKGWHGINIEPNIVKFDEIKCARPKDINLNIGCSGDGAILEFYVLSSHQLSTFSKSQAQIYEQNGYKILSTKKIPTQTLKDVFAKNLGNVDLDFLSIDTEGLDEEILKTNDWKKYRPKIICVENVLSGVDEKIDRVNSQVEFFAKIDYIKVFDTIHLGDPLNSLYIDKGFLKTILPTQLHNDENYLYKEFGFLNY